MWGRGEGAVRRSVVGRVHFVQPKSGVWLVSANQENGVVVGHQRGDISTNAERIELSQGGVVVRRLTSPGLSNGRSRACDARPDVGQSKIITASVVGTVVSSQQVELASRVGEQDRVLTRSPAGCLSDQTHGVCGRRHELPDLLVHGISNNQLPTA